MIPMALPSAVEERVAAEGIEESRVVVRAPYDVGGGLGETYVVADTRRLVLVPRRLGEDFRMLSCAWSEVRSVRFTADGLHRVLEIAVGAEVHRLRFSAWDAEALEALVRLGPGPRPAATGAAARAGGGAPVPGVVFCALLAAVARSDGLADPGELALMVQMTGREDWVWAGMEWLEHEGLDGVLRHARGRLTTVQARCVLANLVRLAMHDGWLRTAERALIEQCRAGLEVPVAAFERLEAVLLARHRLSVLAKAEAGAPRLLALFCGALLGLSTARGPLMEAELGCLQRALDDPEAWEAGVLELRDRSWGGVLGEIRLACDAEQRRCVLANLVALALADGALTTADQVRLEAACDRLGLAASEYEVMLGVLVDAAGTGVLGEESGAGKES